MKKISFIILIFVGFIFNKVEAQNAQGIFIKNLVWIEKNTGNENKKINLNKFYEARKFLIDITGITYKTEKYFNMPIFPPDKTLKEWRLWFNKYKSQLYWDKKMKKVKVNQE